MSVLRPDEGSSEEKKDLQKKAPAKQRNKEVNISSLALPIQKHKENAANKGRKVKNETLGVLRSNSGNGSQAWSGPCPI